MRCKQRRRAAFTLIELMVVVAIIALLVALVTAAVMRALKVVPETETRSDISQMQAAVAQFKARFQLAENPPSKLILYKQIGSYGTTQLEVDSKAFLVKLWGDQIGAGNVQLDWDGNPGTPGPFTLEGHQCLVFFLGGIVTGSPPAPQGFSKNPRNPTQAGGERNGPFFEFRPDKLQAVNGFYCYLDPYGKKPYAYFSSYKLDNGYNRYGTSPLASDCASLNVSPYQMQTPANTPTRYYNPRSFQIISAGKDLAFGPGGLWGSSVALDPRALDDMSNFSDTFLGEP
jgi:prepilin-type N-terminal cleavage/methylation domain-containing protein